MAILVVDDNAELLASIVDFLSIVGYDTLAAEDGASALALAKTPSAIIEMVVSDVEMPGMSGPEMWSQLRSIVGPQCKVIFMSGRGPDLLNKWPELEKSFIVKPFPLKALKDRIDGMMGPA